MTNQEWLRAFARIAGLARATLVPLLGTETGGEEVGTTGAGGDRTLKLDQLVEDVVVAEVQTLADRGERMSLLSEEVGLLDFGADYPRVVVDPVDGSSNARRGLPAVGVMLTLLEGPTMRDVSAGYVIDVTTGRRWSALRRGGAFQDGKVLKPTRMAGNGRIEALALHGQSKDLPRVWPLIKASSEFRNLWCVTLMLAHTATGSLDLFCSPRRARTFDTSAGLLLIREAGGVVTDLEGRPIDGLPVDLRTRTTLLCSAHQDLHRLGLELLHGGVNGPLGAGEELRRQV